MKFADHLKAVSEAHGVTREDILGPSKVPKMVAARRELAHLFCVVAWAKGKMAGEDDNRLMLRHSLPVTGRLMRKDHTSILHTLRAHGAKVYGLPLTASVAQIRAACLASLRPARVAA